VRETNIVVLHDHIPQHRGKTLPLFPPIEQPRDDEEEKETNEHEHIFERRRRFKKTKKGKEYYEYDILISFACEM